MTVKQKNKLWLGFILLYAFIYYMWILIEPGNATVTTFGGNSLSLFGSFIPFFWLSKAAKRSVKKHTTFWLLLTLGSASYFIAELFWFTYESVLNRTLPYPSIADVFYLLNILFFISAFLHELYQNRRTLQVTRHVFDVLLTLIFLTTLKWYFIVEPLILSEGISRFDVFVSLLYPLGDLVLLYCLTLIYFTGKKLFSSKMLTIYFAGILFYTFSDSAFLYLISLNAYSSGSWIDPLFIIGVMLVGYTGLLQQEENLFTDKTTYKVTIHIPYFQYTLPYVGVALLYFMMILSVNAFNSIIIGVGLSLALLSIRQLIVHMDNLKLLKENRQNTKELEDNQERYTSLFNHHPDGAYSLNLQGKVESVNGRGAEIVGESQQSMIGRSILDFLHPDYHELVIQQFRNVKNGIFKHYDMPLINSRKEFYYLSITYVPITSNREVIGVYAIARDITESKINEQQIEYMAYHDHLTHLVNRKRFEEVLDKVIVESEHTRKKFALLFMDMNNFKSINDTYGHAFGDKLLIEVANRIRKSIHEPSFAARLGGDEFTLLIDQLNSYDESMHWASQLLNKLSKPYHIDGITVSSTPSIGFSYYPRDGETAQVLLNKADKSMYENKRQSKKFG